MFRNVMVTVDRSPFAESAIPYAARIARRAEVPVLVVPSTAVDAGLAAGHEESLTHAMYR